MLKEGNYRVMKQRKQFSKKEIERRFYEVYPEGEISLNGSFWNWWYVEKKTIRPKPIRASNLYDVAENLGLASSEEISNMKKLAGYTSYQ